VIATGTCLGFDVACDTLIKGSLSVLMGFILFVGTPLLLLAAIFGRRMGYLVLAVSFFGWMFLLSALWAFGFWSQGTDTPTNLGPRGVEPAWVVESAGTQPEAAYEVFTEYPVGETWRVPGANEADEESLQSVQGAVQSYLAEQANEEQGLEAFDPGAVQTTDFEVQDVRFHATDDGVSLAAAQAYYRGGGPLLTLYLRHDSGSVPVYSWVFMIVSLAGVAIHLPFLDRAEKKRKQILTGGAAPPWYGPA
jgi:hypothetical protein